MAKLRYTQEQARVLDREVAMLELAVHDLATGRSPDAMEVVACMCDAGGTREFRLYRAASPNGGYLVIVVQYPDQGPNTTVVELAEYANRHLLLEDRVAIDRLLIKRDQIAQKEAGRTRTIRP